jgi:glycerol uptake facilitator-like aquaporin
MADVRFSWKLAAEFIGTAALVVSGPGTAAATGVVATSSGAVFSVADLGVIDVPYRVVKTRPKSCHAEPASLPPTACLGCVASVALVRCRDPVAQVAYSRAHDGARVPDKR